MGLESVSREQEGDTATAASDLTKVLPRFHQLGTSEQEELMAKLYDDEENMRFQFGNLVVKTRNSVEERVPVANFAASILALGGYEPAPGEQDRSLLDEHREEIKTAISISEIFFILCAYWNYLSYEILERIIELYGTRDDIERLKNYEKKLHEFFERRTFVVPVSDTGNKQRSRQICVMLNVREDITSQDFLRIKIRIAKILGVPLPTLIINNYF